MDFDPEEAKARARRNYEIGLELSRAGDRLRGMDLSETALEDALMNLSDCAGLSLRPTSMFVPAAIAKKLRDVTVRRVWRESYRTARIARRADLTHILEAALLLEGMRHNETFRHVDADGYEYVTYKIPGAIRTPEMARALARSMKRTP